jgi:hypothetical protein
MPINLLAFHGNKETVGRDSSGIISNRVDGHVQISTAIKNPHPSF